MALATDRERVAALIFYVVLLLLGYLLFQVFQPFLVPLGWAAVLAIFAYPWHVALEQRYGTGRAAALTTFIVAVVLIGPGLLILTALVRETTAGLTALDRDAMTGSVVWAQRAWSWIRATIPGTQALDIAALVDQAFARTAAFIASRAGGLLADVLTFLFQVFVTLLALFFLLRDGQSIMQGVRRVLPFDEARRERMIGQTHDLVYASIRAGLIIAALQGFLGGAIFALLGLKGPVFWGVIMAFLSPLPFLGAWLVWLPAGLWLLATGHVVRGIILLALGGGVIAIVDNIVRPAILSGRARMNGLLVFIALLGGVNVFGLLGLVLGPLIVALVGGLIEGYTGREEIVVAERSVD